MTEGIKYHLVHNVLKPIFHYALRFGERVFLDLNLRYPEGLKDIDLKKMYPTILNCLDTFQTLDKQFPFRVDESNSPERNQRAKDMRKAINLAFCVMDNDNTYANLFKYMLTKLPRNFTVADWREEK